MRAVTSSLIALEGALLGAPGVVIVSGTGSVVLGKQPTGKLIKVGGWGPLLGNEGSAQWVAREALRAAARATDGTGPETLLVEALRRQFGVRAFERIIDVVYEHPMNPAELGALAPLVATAAQRGDRIALDIFRRAGQELAVQAARAIRLLGIKQPSVSYQGSMFRAGQILLGSLRTSLKRLAPQALLVEPALPPIGGAFRLALGALGQAATPRAIAAFRRSCNG